MSKSIYHEKSTHICEYGCNQPAHYSILPTHKAKNRKWCCSNYFNSCSFIKDRKRQRNLDKYGVEDATQTEEALTKRKATMLERHGVENAFQMQKVIDGTKARDVKGKYTLEWFLEKYPEDGEERYKRKNYECGHSLERYQERFGEEEGKRRWLENNKKSAVTEAKMIAKYGEEEGAQRWNTYRERQRYTNSVEYFQEKFGPEEGKKRWLESYGRLSGHSKMADDFFSNLNLEGAYWGENEWIVFLDKETKRKARQATIRPDYRLGNKIIEFFGNGVHGNPSMFGPNQILDYYRQDKVTAQQKWFNDYQRKKILEELGFTVLIIWESEWKKSPEETLSRCRAFLNS